MVQRQGGLLEFEFYYKNQDPILLENNWTSNVLECVHSKWSYRKILYMGSQLSYTTYIAFITSVFKASKFEFVYTKVLIIMHDPE